MMAILPISLTGNNLGQRYRQLNKLVNDAYFKRIPFSSIQDFPEQSALDRLFKIDLASKYKDLDYITENLKHEDMLYVSRALKCTWLLNKEYSEIINPSYLENVLYPEMTTTAVNKMKHWVELHLREPERNKEFYQFYVHINFDASIKFISKCSKEFILSEATKGLLERIEPDQLKLLIEKCPDVAKLYFESLETNNNILEKYLRKEKKYYTALKVLLKVNGDDFLNVTEKYFNLNRFSRLSPEATKYVIKNYKARFNMKPELYTSALLDIKTLAKHLGDEEIKDLVVKLARAQYIQQWFSYKNVEPLIKKLSIEERTSFKKSVFVEKAIGDVIETWPYEIPSSPVLKSTESNIFKDKEHDPYDYDFIKGTNDFRNLKRRVMKKSGKWHDEVMMMSTCPRKSSLDQLFDRYRFVGFEKTFFDLRKQLNVETLQHRQNIMLVLISKSGGRVESLEELLKFLVSRHENEPENLRATVIRSLVRRCCVWRLPQNVWELLLKFGRGVGLDGIPSTVACREGLHAVIIRNIILDQDIDPAVWNAFVEEFSCFMEYSLNTSEKEKISTKLPELLTSAAENDIEHAVGLLEKALDSLETYRMRIDKFPNLVTMISKTAHNNADAEPLVRRLFNARIARKELFKENFVFIQNNASYYNALKHDTSVLITGKTFEALISTNRLAHDKFITTLSLYFNEENGLATKYLALLKKHIKDEKLKKHKLARYVAILSGESVVEILKDFNDAQKKSESRRIAAALRANCHLARPLVNLNTFDLKYIGAKAVSNRVLKCSTKYSGEILQSLIAWDRTQRLVFILSTRVGKEANLLQAIGEKRPRVALKLIFRHLKTKKLDEAVWNTILHLIKTMNTPNKINDRLREALFNTKLVPANRKAEYCMAVFELFRKISNKTYVEMPMLCNIENILYEIDPEFIETVIRRFLNEEFTIEKLPDGKHSYNMSARMHIRITAKHLLLCKSHTEQDHKWDSIGELFFDRFHDIWNTKTSAEVKTKLKNYLNAFLQSLKYNKVFLDTGYVSSLPMFERIVNRLQNILPIHKNLHIYISLHLTMLYFKSVRQSVKNNATVFEDLPKNVNQAALITGRIFGKLVAYEVIELMDKYFESIIEIYKGQLTDYLESFFECTESWIIMISNMVRSFLEHDNSKVQLLAVHMYKTVMRFNCPEKESKEVFEKLNESKNMEVLLRL